MQVSFSRKSILYLNSKPYVAATVPRPAIRRRRRTRLTDTVLIVALLAFGLSSVLQLFRTPAAQADEASGLMNGSAEQLENLQNSGQNEPPDAENSDQAQDPDHAAATDTCLAPLAAPTPIPPAVRVVQLVNCSNQTILGAANAAGTPSLPAHYPVFPREGTWVMQPVGAANNANVLTIDVPPQWASTGPVKSIGPNIWARTGCRYDIPSGRAQCETGGCGGQYDCSSAALGISGYTTFTEWNFYQEVAMQSYHLDNFDVSAVNGVSLNVDIQPVGGDTSDPGNPINPFWEYLNYPLTAHAEDLRSDNLCTADFLLKRSDIDKSGIFGYVILGNDGKPLGGDGTIACLNNCGKYEYPTPPPLKCLDITNPDCFCTIDDSAAGKRCYNWKTFCAGDPNEYGVGHQCKVNGVYRDDLCPVNGACWKNPGSDTDGTCQLRAFYAKPDCPPEVCTYQGGNYINLYTGMTVTNDLSTQPPAGLCKKVDPNNPKASCIGDDTIHKVLHNAYTWPNDPQTYVDDAPLYRVIYAPGGTTVPITAPGPIPVCSDLSEKIYGPSHQYGGPTSGTLGCDITVNRNNAVFGVAVPAVKCTNNHECPNNNCNKSIGWCSNWGCDLDPRGSGDEGVVCRWHAAPATNCSPPTIDSYVTKSACGLIASGASLVSSSITPASGDPLFAEVVSAATIQAVSAPSAISGCVSSWSTVKSQPIQGSEGIAIWYSGTANTSSPCNVTVSLPSNPSSLKVYDIPLSNGTVETSNSVTGGPTTGPIVGAGSVTTLHTPDLLLGNLIMANQLFTPRTYWGNPLSDTNGFPTDDGADNLPGWGSYSGSADAGHQFLGSAGTYSMTRPSFSLGSTDFGGAAIAIELSGTASTSVAASGSAPTNGVASAKQP